jgi:hypothetical protein
LNVARLSAGDSGLGASDAATSLSPLRFAGFAFDPMQAPDTASRFKTMTARKVLLMASLANRLKGGKPNAC